MTNMQFPRCSIDALIAIIIWNVLEKLVVPSGRATFRRHLERRDDAVWIAICDPKMQVFSLQDSDSAAVLSPPYKTSQIAQMIGRREKSVLRTRV